MKSVGERQNDEDEERHPGCVRLSRRLELQSIICVVVQDRLAEAKEVIRHTIQAMKLEMSEMLKTQVKT